MYCFCSGVLGSWGEHCEFIQQRIISNLITNELQSTPKAQTIEHFDNEELLISSTTTKEKLATKNTKSENPSTFSVPSYTIASDIPTSSSGVYSTILQTNSIEGNFETSRMFSSFLSRELSLEDMNENENSTQKQILISTKSPEHSLVNDEFTSKSEEIENKNSSTLLRSNEIDNNKDAKVGL